MPERSSTPERSSELVLADDFALPLDAVTETFAILAKRGMGKTYTASVMVEELVKAGQPVTVIDPVGVWWGLRADADGSGPGLPIAILGGDHADAPLPVDAGAIVAEMIAEDRLSVVLDLSLMRKGEQTRFMESFAETLYHRNRDALHLVLDEADLFAPQRPLPGQQRLLGAVEDLVRRGRARGLGVTMITQRASVLNKDVLTQAEVLIALRTVSRYDLDAVDAWVRVHGTPEQREEMMSSLPSLPIGTAWFWSPGWLGVFVRVHVRRRETFNSSATPAPGQARAEPKTLASVDLAALRTRLAAAVDRTKDDDPKELRRRIAGLERELRERPAETIERVVEKRVEIPVLKEELVTALTGQADGMRAMAKDLMVSAHELVRTADQIMTAIGAAQTPASSPVTPARPEPMPVTPEKAWAPPVKRGAAPIPTMPAGGEGVKMPIAERKILSVLAQYPQGRTKQQVAILTGYAVGGGGFGNAISALRSRGWAAGGSDNLQATEAGLEALGTWEPLPTGRALVTYWQGKLGKTERMVLQALVDVYPQALTKQQIADRTGYAEGGGGFGNALSRLRTLELIEGRAAMKASAAFFE